MSNPYLNGWLAEREKLDFERFFGAAETVGDANVLSTNEAVTMIEEAARHPVTTHPWRMAERLFESDLSPYRRLTVWNQDANNCAGHATARAVDAFAMIRCWLGDRYELSPFENFVPWVWGVGKNEADQTGSGGATIGAMLAMIAAHGVLPCDTPGLPPYEGTSNRWARRYGKQAKNAPYSPFWDVAKKYRVTVAPLPQDAELFHLACKAGFSIAFGTSQRIIQMQNAECRMQNGETIQQYPAINAELNPLHVPHSELQRDYSAFCTLHSAFLTPSWAASGSWMHAMAAYGYDEELDAVGIDNSHGDGFAWAGRDVLVKVVDRARYFDAFVILEMQSRPGAADWHLIGRP